MILLRVVLPVSLILAAIWTWAYHKDGQEKQAISAKKTAVLEPGFLPNQFELETADPITLVKSGYIWQMYPRAGYQIMARVLQSKTYVDWQATFSPVDLALGWGMMSDPAVDRWVEVWQEDRWYFYRKEKGAPFSLEDIRVSSANVHIIPANDEVATIIQSLQPNDIILLEGKLVDVEVDKLGELFQFQTSLTRFDSEDNSCEIFYVERITFGANQLNQTSE